MSALGFDPGLVMGIVTLVSALAAVGLTLVFNLQKYVLIILSTIAGAALVVLAGMLAFGQVTVNQLQRGESLFEPILQGSWFWGLVWLVLVVVGVVVQIRANRTYVFTKEMYVEGWG
jgi:hypothetical protein